LKLPQQAGQRRLGKSARQGKWSAQSSHRRDKINLPIELRLGGGVGGGAVFPRKDIGRPAARELRDADGGARSADARKQEHRLRARRGCMIPFVGHAARRPTADGVAAALEAELARRKAKAQWDTNRNEREWMELFATYADIGRRMLAGHGRRGDSRGAELAREVAQAEDWERVYEFRIPADHSPADAAALAWATAPEAGLRLLDEWIRTRHGQEFP
jgi:hypothetical protein